MVFQDIMFSNTEELAIPLEAVSPKKPKTLMPSKVLFVGKKT